jgi:hypothetical protein
MRRTFVCGGLGLAALTSATPATAEQPLRAPTASRPYAETRAPEGHRPEVQPLALRFTLSPEWAYRAFRDTEPNSTTKRYNAAGVPTLGGRVELYPFALLSPAPEVAKDFGITASYFRAFGFTSRDIDTDSTADTRWYQFSFGVRYRVLGESNPLSLGFTANLQRWIFDFALLPADRTVALGRYTILPVGADVRYTWGALSAFADGRFLLPFSISPPGDRQPSGVGVGVSAVVGAAVAIARVFEVEARATYNLLSYSLASRVNPSENGRVFDEYLMLGIGASFLY